MRNSVVNNVIDRGILSDKRIFTTSRFYKRFMKTKNRPHNLKPGGLWYAIGSSWLEWCMGEEYDGIGKYIYEIELSPSANILLISKKEQVYSFTEKYKKNYDCVYGDDRYLTLSIVNWKRVMQDYDGIEVNPYFCDLRLSCGLTWYYGWDVPGGCVWKAAAKKRVTLLAEYDSGRKKFVLL